MIRSFVITLLIYLLYKLDLLFMLELMFASLSICDRACYAVCSGLFSFIFSCKLHYEDCFSFPLVPRPNCQGGGWEHSTKDPPTIQSHFGEFKSENKRKSLVENDKFPLISLRRFLSSFATQFPFFSVLSKQWKWTLKPFFTNAFEREKIFPFLLFTRCSKCH